MPRLPGLAELHPCLPADRDWLLRPKSDGLSEAQGTFEAARPAIH